MSPHTPAAGGLSIGNQQRVFGYGTAECAFEQQAVGRWAFGQCLESKAIARCAEQGA